MRKVICFLFVLTIFISCDGNLVYSECVPIENGWGKDDEKTFVFSMQDTINPYNLFVMLQNDRSYPFQNIYLITKMKMPDNRTVIDTLQYQMTDAQGRWLGSGVFVKENKLWYKQGITFPIKGEYVFSVSQAMRKVSNPEGVIRLDGITYVGLRIEKQK